MHMKAEVYVVDLVIIMQVHILFLLTDIWFRMEERKKYHQIKVVREYMRFVLLPGPEVRLI